MATGDKDRQVLSKIVSGKIMKKYRLVNFAKKSLRVISRKRLRHNTRSFHIYERKERLDAKDGGKIAEFILRDDNSRVCTTTKRTKTKDGVKKQIRFLNDSMKNLHAKFLGENAEYKVSYSVFCLHRPFYVLEPKVSDRDTCACKKHDNIQFQADRLHELKIIEAKRVEDNIKYVVRDEKSLNCMYGICKCENRMPFAPTVALNTDIWWHQWNTVQEKYSKDGQEKTALKYVRSKVTGTVLQLQESFLQALKQELSPHVFNIRHQYQAYRKLKHDIAEDSAIVHIDFSENWTCKYASAIQSTHFGAANQQVTLHTGVLYTHLGTSSFCTLSPSKRHDPVAIWAHLLPIMKDLRQKDITVVRFFSDGPTTQYRNRSNIYLFSSLLFDMGFDGATWNYFEAGHGKGAADGIGGVVKRTADDLVAKGKDIPDAHTLHRSLLDVNLTTKLHFIEENQITEMAAKTPTNIPAVRGIMKVHQVCTQGKCNIQTKVLSCFCSWPTICTCYLEHNYILGAEGEEDMLPNDQQDMLDEHDDLVQSRGKTVTMANKFTLQVLKSGQVIMVMAMMHTLPRRTI